MSRSVRFEPAAASELADAADWYEDQGSELGLEFFAAVAATIGVISEWPDSGSTVEGQSEGRTVRRLPVARSPYQVVYLVPDAAIRVLAIAHERRRPAYWSGR